MKIKHLLMAVCCVGITSFSFGQTSDAEADAIVNLLGVQKKEAVAHLVAVTPKDSVVFWKIYEEYLTENKKTGKERLRLYEQTASSYTSLNSIVADSLAKRYFINREGQEKVLQQYYQKMKSSINAIVAFQFYQAEVYILTQLRAQIMQQIPTYGQLMNTGPKKNY
jgi:hypothetical protein